MSMLLGTRAGVKSVRFWQLSSCWLIFRWWLFLRVFPLWAQLGETEVGVGGRQGRARGWLPGRELPAARGRPLGY